MLIIWLVLIIVTTLLVKWFLTTKHEQYTWGLSFSILVLLCILEMVFVYFFIGTVVDKIIQGLEVFYN